MRRRLLRPKKGELLRVRKHLYSHSGSGWRDIVPGTVIMFLKKLEQTNSNRHYLVLHEGRATTIMFLYYQRISDHLERIWGL
jgi:hypothetical protein